jgi:cell growth-regulating nucleolar protein
VKKSRRASSYVSYGTTTSKPTSTKHTTDKPDRARDPDRKYHDDKHQRWRYSAERNYYDDKYHHRRRHESLSSEDKPNGKHLKAIEYPERPTSVQPNGDNQLVSYMTRGDLFMSFINKGPDSERGCSINKILKRYHRERHVRGEEKEEEDKDLWKSLRLRRNDRGEIVLFI